MKVIVNQHINNGKIQNQWAHVIGSNNRPHRINSYSNLTDSSVRRIIWLASSAKCRIYDGEEGQGYILETTYNI